MNHISKKFFTGINYWGSGNAINMWEQFDAASIETDLKLLSSVGITHLRVFPLWPIFQPLHAVYGPNHVYEYAFGESPLPDTPAGKAGVSEEACQHFQTFCQLAEQYGMRLIVALITGHMSFRTYAPPAFEGKALLSDPTVIKWQRRFVKYFVTRFKDESIIIGWDLGNEVINMPGLQGLHPDAFSVWCGTIADAIRSCDSSRPIISGLDHASVEAGACNLRMIGEICDINTVHPYNIFSTASDPLNTMQPILDLPFQCQLSEDVAKIPTFVQEFGSIGYMNCSEKTEADFYRACLLTTLTHGCHGTMWWCAFDQGHFDYAPYRWNTIGSDYGFFTRELKAKPVARENLEFQDLLRALPGGTLPKHTTNATVLIPRDDGGADIPLLRTTYILAKQANIDVCFRYILDPIPESSLYIIPSIKTNKALPKDRLDCLLEKVREGSVLYLCAHKGLIRQLPTMTGVTFSYREEINREKTLNLQGSLLPITTHYFYQPESTSAEIVGVDEAGEGVFFKYAYGKGWVYLLTLPLEAALSEKKGVFFRENQPPYHKIYRKLAQTAGIVRICDSDHPYVRLTEHIIDESTLYVAAINYSNKPAIANLTVLPEYRISAIYGHKLEGTTLHLRENDGILLKLTKD